MILLLPELLKYIDNTRSEKELNNKVEHHFCLYRERCINILSTLTCVDFFYNIVCTVIEVGKRHKVYWKTTKCPLQMGPIQNQ